MNHVEEHILELYVLGAPEAQDRARDIAEHLKVCAGCRELHGEITAYHHEVGVIAEELARKASEAIVVRAVGAEPAFRADPAGFPTHLPARARIVLFVMRHPVLSGGTMLGGIILLALGISLLRLPSDPRPAHMRAENGALVIMDRDGRELWRRYVGSLFTEASLQNTARQQVVITDVDGDGRSEVILALGDYPEWERHGAVVCLSADGKEKWSYTLHRNMIFGAESFADTYRSLCLVAGDFDRDGNTEVVVIFHITMYYPCAVLCLEGKTGNPVSEYWHSGVLGFALPFDANADGKQEVFLFGENNGFNRAVALALDPLHMSGHGPAPPAYTPQGIPEAHEVAYLLLPPSDVNGLAGHRPAASNLLLETDTSLIAVTAEFLPDNSYPLLFHFDNLLRCTKVVGSDEYMKFHLRQYQDGRLKRPADAAYFEELRHGPSYWNGTEFLPGQSGGPGISHR